MFNYLNDLTPSHGRVIPLRGSLKYSLHCLTISLDEVSVCFSHPHMFCLDCPDPPAVSKVPTANHAHNIRLGVSGLSSISPPPTDPAPHQMVISRQLFSAPECPEHTATDLTCDLGGPGATPTFGHPYILNMLYVMDIRFAQKSNNRTPLRVLSGRLLLPITFLQVSLSMESVVCTQKSFAV